MPPLPSGRRLCLLFVSAGARYAIEATSVTEVATPGPNPDNVRGSLEIRDLSRIFWGGAEVRPGTALVLDTSPTLAVRVEKVLGVFDLSACPVFLLPPAFDGLAELPARGVVLYQGTLYVELDADRISALQGRELPRRSRASAVLEAPPDQALVFESEGGRWGLSLGLVTQVVPSTGTLWRIPWNAGALGGFFLHGQVLWGIYSLPALVGRNAVVEEHLVLAELAGHSVAISARRVLGIFRGFSPGAQPGNFLPARGEEEVVFLDLQRMFS